MAEKTINKSKAIRDYKTALPEATPAEIADALTRQGVEVSASFVSTTLWKASQETSPPKTRQRVDHRRVAVQDLLAAKQFAARVGGAAEAKRLVAAVGKLSGASRG